MPPDCPGLSALSRDRWRRRLYGLCRRRPSLILGTMAANPGGAAPAERSHPLRDGGRADRVRASDADRDDAISQLRERYAEGRLTHDTLSHRLEAALQARYQDDLAQVLADLPAQALAGRHLAGVLAAGPRDGGQPDSRPPAAGV